MLALYSLPPPPMKKGALPPNTPAKSDGRTKVLSGRISASQPLPDRHVPSSSHSLPADVQGSAAEMEKDQDRHDSQSESVESETSEEVDSDLLEQISADSDSDVAQNMQRQEEEDTERNRRRANHVQAKTALVVLVLSLWTLRVPVLYLDIIQ